MHVAEREPIEILNKIIIYDKAASASRSLTSVLRQRTKYMRILVLVCGV